MRASFAAPLAIAALAVAAPQGVTSAISPSSTAPAGCSSSYSGTFAIQIVNVTSSSKRAVEKRDDTTLVMSLANGILLDSQGRTGYIASNRQFQFDKPAQAGAIYTAGWSVCGNGSLAIGANAIFYQCLSGTFYNLYDQSTGAQCSPVYIDAISNGGSTSSATTGVASQTSDGQITASAVASQQSDGQITATAGVTTSAKVSQISDGQIQATTAASSAAKVSQISDGQIQATTATSSAAKVSQISDGQIQATTAAAASSSTTAALVSQISDGQIQATTKSNTTVASATATAAKYTGAAVPISVRGELFGLAAGVLAVAML